MSELLAAPERMPLEQLLESEAYRTLRREVAFLSDIHRRIIVLHYYDGVKQSDIAKLLNIPVNTVKWHLSNAKKELRKGMERMHTVGELSVNPVRFTGTGHAGSPGQLGETGDFLGRPLAQNIVYAAYHMPLSVREIAQELGMPPALLEGEVRHLTEYAFLIEVENGKFQSNTIIWDNERPAEEWEAHHRNYQACAAKVAEAHYEALLGVRKQVADSGIYYPDQDYNFLLWTLLPKTIEEQAWRSLPNRRSLKDVAPLRKDGGHYIAYATLENTLPKNLSFDLRHYDYCGTMNRSREGSPLYLWQLNTYWSDRKDWRFVNFKDVEICNSFWKGDLPDDEPHREQYAFLLEKGYIRKGDSGYQFNVVWVDSPDILNRLNAAMPDLSGLYASPVTELYEKTLAVAMQRQPKHLEPQIAHMVRGDTAGGTLTTYILKYLVDRGLLREPLPHQRKTITTWMGPVR